jgi:hypothetical protein
MWLCAAWILVSPDVHHEPSDHVLASIYDLAKDVGRPGVLVAVSVIAYLVGSVSQGLSDALVSVVFESNQLTALTMLERIGRFRRLENPERIDRAEYRALVAISNQADEATSLLDEATIANIQKEASTELMRRGGAARTEAARELNLPATLLVGDKPELFAEVDRLRAEGDLRLTTAAPALALVVILAVTQSAWWLFGIAMLVWLLIQGLSKVGASRKLIADAIAQRRVDSSSQTEFESWVTEFVATDIPDRFAAAARFTVVRAIWSSEDHEVDVTPVVQGLATRRGVSFIASNETLGNDPQYGATKRLELTWRAKGEEKTQVFSENAAVVISA